MNSSTGEGYSTIGSYEKLMDGFRKREGLPLDKTKELSYTDSKLVLDGAGYDVMQAQSIKLLKLLIQECKIKYQETKSGNKEKYYFEINDNGKYKLVEIEVSNLKSGKRVNKVVIHVDSIWKDYSTMYESVEFRKGQVELMVQGALLKRNKYFRKNL